MSCDLRALWTSYSGLQSDNSDASDVPCYVLEAAGEDHDLDEVAVCDSDSVEGHNGSVGVLLSNEHYLPVGNRGDSDPAEGGIACDIVKSCLRSGKTISPGNDADQWCWWQERYLSQ